MEATSLSYRTFCFTWERNVETAAKTDRVFETLLHCCLPFQLKPEEIDPLTLFIGNLPNAVTVYTVKQMFPTARRIDIGHAQRMKHTRYAFIRFHNVGDAIAAFKANFNKVIDGKNIIVRFRRHNAPIAMPEDTNTPKTPKRQKGLGQLFVSVEQKPMRNVRSTDKAHNLEIHHSGSGWQSLQIYHQL